MNPTLLAALDVIKEKINAANALMADPTPDNVGKATTMQAEIDTLQGQYDQALAAFKTQERQRLFLTQPTDDRTPFQTRVEGMTESGAAFLSSETGKLMIQNVGEGLLTDRQFLATTAREYADAFRSYLRKGEKGLTGPEIRILQEGVDGQGGFTVPVDFIQKLLSKDPTPTRVQDQVFQMTTGSDTVEIPTNLYSTDNLYTTPIRATWSGEGPATSASILATTPTFGLAKIPIMTAMLSLPLTNNMVEDASFPIQAWVEDKFLETIVLLKENMILNGTGIGQPTGILANPNGTIGGRTQPITVATGNPTSAIGLESIAFSLPEQYDQNAKWVFNKTSTGKQIASLQDANQRFMWGMGLQDSGMMVGGRGLGTKDRDLFGYPVLLQGFMPNQGGGAYPIIFGDLGGYYLINRIGFSIQVLREVYAEVNQIMLVGRVRFGGMVCEDWKLLVGVSN